MPISKQDLRFATFYQLAGMIRDDWEFPPSMAEEALGILDSFDQFTGDDNRDFLLLRAMEMILYYSSDWNTDDSEQIKLELDKRRKEYAIEADERKSSNSAPGISIS